MQTHLTPPGSSVSDGPTAPETKRPLLAVGRLVVVLSVAVSSIVLVPRQGDASTMTVTPDQATIVCTGGYASIGRLTGASPSETLLFVSSPPTDFLPALTNSSGNYTVLWRCDPAEAGMVWSVQVTGARSNRSAVFTVQAAPTTTVPPTTVPSTVPATPCRRTVPASTVPATSTVPASTVPATFVPVTSATTSAPSDTSIPEPLGPTISEPAVVSLFQATTIEGMVTAFDFVEADAEILRLYWAFFLREAEPDGAKYWIAQRRSGLSLDDIAWAFSESAEFELRYGPTDDRQFLDIVYRNVLGRTYDSAGFTYWMTEIQRGLPRSGTVRWIAANAEFVLAHPYG